MKTIEGRTFISQPRLLPFNFEKPFIRRNSRVEVLDEVETGLLN